MEYEEIDLWVLEEAYDELLRISQDEQKQQELAYRELQDAYDDYLLDISELYGGDDIDYQEFYDGFLGGYL